MPSMATTWAPNKDTLDRLMTNKAMPYHAPATSANSLSR